MKKAKSGCGVDRHLAVLKALAHRYSLCSLAYVCFSSQDLPPSCSGAMVREGNGYIGRGGVHSGMKGWNERRRTVPPVFMKAHFSHMHTHAHIPTPTYPHPHSSERLMQALSHSI